MVCGHKQVNEHRLIFIIILKRTHGTIRTYFRLNFQHVRSASQVPKGHEVGKTVGNSMSPSGTEYDFRSKTFHPYRISILGALLLYNICSVTGPNAHEI